MILKAKVKKFKSKSGRFVGYEAFIGRKSLGLTTTRQGAKRLIRDKRRKLMNPPSKTHRRAIRVASNLAYRIWRQVKSRGYALPLPKRTPKVVRKYVRIILKANRINWKV